MPRFSVILVHYQGSINHLEFCRGVNSLIAQTHQDFELLAYHDGPLIEPSAIMPISLVCTEERHNDWGHSLRDRGIREAKGDYIVHLSSDNILYPNALMEISTAIDRPPRIVHTRTRTIGDSNRIIIFSILQRGMQRLGSQLIRNRKRPDYTLLMTGNPPQVTFIDCLQLVMRREIWLDEGGWYDKTYDGDGLMYQKFAAKYGYRAIDTVLGEHY